MAKTEVKIKHESMALFFTLKKKCESDPAMSNLGHTWTEKSADSAQERRRNWASYTPRSLRPRLVLTMITRYRTPCPYDGFYQKTTILLLLVHAKQLGMLNLLV